MGEERDDARDTCVAIARAVRDGEHNETVALVHAAIETGIPPSVILKGGLTPGLRSLDALFENGEVFLPEILISVRAMDAGLKELDPFLAENRPPDKGVVVLGTVAGDLHDIGKRLVGMLLRGNGFNVVDLGVDVPASAFVTAAVDHGADIVALSALLTTTTPEFQRVVGALDAAGVRSRVAVMVGGAPVTPALAAAIGADGYADDCMRAVSEAERLIAARGRA